MNELLILLLGVLCGLSIAFTLFGIIYSKLFKNKVKQNE